MTLTLCIIAAVVLLPVVYIVGRLHGLRDAEEMDIAKALERQQLAETNIRLRAILLAHGISPFEERKA